jgi:flagellar biosynthesis anti-sigma factor FlgM
VKINPKLLDATGASQAGKAQEAAGTTAGQGRGGAGRAGSETDQVSLSSLSNRLLELASMDKPERAARVESVTADVRSGRYKVDAMAVSKAMVQEAVGHGS